MKKTLIILLSAISLISCSKKEEAKEEMEAYLMVYFTDPTHSLFFALSTDGYTFTSLNDGQPLFGGDTLASQKGIRDPHISRGKDGAFYIAMTDLHVFGQEMGIRDTKWERPHAEHGWGNNHGFVLMKSYDLINWTNANFHLDKTYDLDLSCAWAPQTIYDPIEDKMMIYYTMRLSNGRTKMYYSYTDDDFTKLITPPELLFDYPDTTIQVLDADILQKPDGTYFMTYVAQHRPVGIKMATSEFINRGYKYDSTWLDYEPGHCEAPNVWQRIGEDKWVLMYDIFSIQPHNFGFVETSDFQNFEYLGHLNEGVMKTTNYTSPKHGAVIHLTRKEAQRLADHWGTEINFE